MAARSRHIAFGDNHPLVPATYFAGTILLAAFVMQPVYLALSLAGSVLCSVCCVGPRETFRQLRWQLLVALLVCAGNVLVGHVGNTVLVALGPLEVRLEPLAYGLCMGAMLVSVVEWFACAASCLGVDKVLGLGGGVLPTVSTMVSMAMGLVPQLVRRAHMVDATLDACSAAKGHSARSRAQAGERDSGEGGNSVRRSTGRKVSAAGSRRTEQHSQGAPVPRLGRAARTSNLVMSWALEDSLVRADSMRARGWESGARRSSYRMVHFSTGDALLEALILVLAFASALLAGRAAGEWHFYPTMPQLVWWWGYVPYALYVVLLTILAALDRFRWVLLEVK